MSLNNCIPCFFVHNHPSGDPTPSELEVGLNKRLEEAGELLGIEVLDHIIIGNPDYVSMKRKGLFKSFVSCLYFYKQNE